MSLNKWLVGVQRDQIVIGLPMRTARMSKAEALELAAWLVAMASVNVEEDFKPILDEVFST